MPGDKKRSRSQSIASDSSRGGGGGGGGGVSQSKKRPRSDSTGSEKSSGKGGGGGGVSQSKKRPRSDSTGSDKSSGKGGGGGGDSKVRRVQQGANGTKYSTPVHKLPLQQRLYILYRSKLGIGKGTEQTNQRRKQVMTKLCQLQGKQNTDRSIPPIQFKKLLETVDSKKLSQLEHFILQRYGPFQDSLKSVLSQHPDVGVVPHLLVGQLKSLLETSKGVKEKTRVDFSKFRTLPIDTRFFRKKLSNPLKFIKYLENHPNLEELNLYDIGSELKLTDEIIPYIISLKKLKKLNLGRIYIYIENIENIETNALIKLLKSLPNLEVLDLSQCLWTFDSLTPLGGGGGKQQLGTKRLLPKLRELNISFNDMKREDINGLCRFIESLTLLPSLETLRMNSMELSDRNIVQLAPYLKSLTKLQTLELSDNNMNLNVGQADDVGNGIVALNAIIPSLKNLRVLNLSGNFLCSWIGEDVLLKFDFDLYPKTLEFLDLSNNELTEYDVARLKEKAKRVLPHLKIDFKDQRDSEQQSQQQQSQQQH